MAAPKRVLPTRPELDDSPVMDGEPDPYTGDDQDDDDPAPLETVPAAAPAAELSDGDAPAELPVDETGETIDSPATMRLPSAPAPGPRPSRRERREERKTARLEQRTGAATNPAMRDLTRREDQGVADWIESITGGQAAIRVSVHREHPQIHMGIKCNGLLDTFDHPIDEAFIKEKFGGGKLTIKVLRRHQDGSYKYAKSTMIEVAGEPNIEHLRSRDGHPPPALAAAAAPSANDQIAGKAFDILARQATEQRAAPSGPDYNLLDKMLAPMREQLARVTQQLEAKDKELREARNQPADPLKDKFVEKLMDSDSARIEAIRTRHESELRTLRDNHAADIARIHAQYDRERSDTVRAHEREVSNMKQGYERELATTRTMYEGQLTNAKGTESIIKVVTDAEHKRLERENERLHKEVAELRAKKDKGPVEMAKELKLIKEVLGDDDDDDEKSTLEKVLESPMAGKVVDKIGSLFGGAEQQAAAQQPQQQQFQPGQIPPGVPYRLPDGRVARNLPDGRVMILQPKQMPPGATGTAPPGAPGVAAPGTAAADPAQIAEAVAFMEGAFRSGTDPKAFASSVRNMVPQSVLQQLAALGVDDFLEKVAQLDATSPLSQQAGRLWARKVGKALVGGDE